jgi:hypothetical protein
MAITDTVIMLAIIPPIARRLVASELSMLSKGLPPPPSILPDFRLSNAAPLIVCVIELSVRVADDVGNRNVVSVVLDENALDGDGESGVLPIIPLLVGCTD